MKSESILIIDTIRPDFFKTIFKKVEVIKEDIDTVHKSKRIICKNQWFLMIKNFENKIIILLLSFIPISMVIGQAISLANIIIV